MKFKHQKIVRKYNIRFRFFDRNSPYLVNSDWFLVSDHFIYFSYIYSDSDQEAKVCIYDAGSDSKLSSTVIYEKHYYGKLNTHITELLIISLLECFRDKL